MEHASAGRLVWVNGQRSADVDARDRGLAFGDGLFETMRYGPHGIPLLAYHLHRLQAGCSRLSIPIDSTLLAQELDVALAASIERQPSGVLKLIVTRGIGGRGYRASDVRGPTRVLIASPAPEYPPEWSRDGVVVRYCDLRLGASPALAGLKHLNRLEQVIARAEWDDPAIAEGLLCDTRGRIVEGVSTNLFLVSAGRVLTPVIEHCGVAGVMRQYLIEEGLRALGLSASEVACERGMLGGAQELFLCNSVVGIWPIRQLAGRTLAPGPLTQRIRAHVDERFVA
jgi:4-amino-4-deoxychorismate lyase